MQTRSGDQGFDNFRKERKRLQAKLGGNARVLGYENDALRELEQVEMREVRDQQLTREVHEFFASATKQAAGIVERVAKDAQVETGERIEQEMEAFLIDALSRMNTFVVAVLQQRRAPIAEQQMEPKIGNLVGQSLDEFRWAGTADLGDKHIGQDPFATDVDDVCREFRAVTADAAGAEANATASSIEDHLVAGVEAEPAPECTELQERLAAVAAAAPTAPARAVAKEAVPADVHPSAAAPAAAGGSNTNLELELFKTVLKGLVKQGTMSRDEARAAWQTRLKTVAAERG